ncbi:winged helix-turn-helix domain-containing protein [Micromonospora sp. CPCC 205371]|nr:winged helix-turn-helix domain-containing protein [Micromonospora sp. CPCC 205371]
MLKIFFTSDDVARTRIATGPDPLWELVLSVHMLRGQTGDLLFRHWQTETRSKLRRAGGDLSVRLLLDVIPTMGYFPDFLNPIAALEGLDAGIRAVRSTPIRTLRAELAAVKVPTRSSAGVRRLACGDSDALERFTTTMRNYYDIAVRPLASYINTVVQRDRAIRAHAQADKGVEGMFASLRPMMSWNAGELSVPSHRRQEMHLNGRGITLIPSYFCIQHPVTLLDSRLPPVLIYPARLSGHLTPLAPQQPSRRLAALIGNTRAAVLHNTIAGATTSDIARQVGIAAATASIHATVLRDCGLITSFRDGNRMIHRISRLGLELIGE